jgi:hypothetical protein
MDIKVRQQLEELKGTANGEALRLYLDEEIKRMQNIMDINDELDLHSKQQATKILESMFKFLEKKEVISIKSKYN